MKFTKLSALSALLSLAIAACCDAHAAVRRGENILVNGTFESDQAPCPPGWANYDRVRVKPTPAGGPEGHPFLRFSSETPPPEESSVRQYGIHLAPEGQYRFTVFVRARDFKLANGGIALIRNGRKFDAGNLPRDTGGKWVRLSNSFKSFPGEGAYACVLYVAGWTGELDIADIRLVPGVEFFDFFEAVAKETGDGGYLGVADRARAFIDAGPFRTWNWDGQFEDMDPMPPYVDLTPVRAFGFSQLLFRKGRTDDARLTLSWCEDQFAVWSDPIHHMDWKNWKMPTGLEQYDYYTPIDATMANFVRSFIVAWKATGEELYLEKARAMADCIVRNQRKDGTIPTYFDSRGGSDWVNCMASSADSLMAFAEALKSAGKATAGR